MIAPSLRPPPGLAPDGGTFNENLVELFCLEARFLAGEAGWTDADLFKGVFLNSSFSALCSGRPRLATTLRGEKSLLK